MPAIETGEAAGSSRTTRIMVVDDDIIIRRMLTGVLSQRVNYQVSAFEDCGRAWQALSQGLLPDLCILDVILPDRDGVTFLSRMRTVPALARVPAIMCTVVDAAPIVKKCVALGVRSYLTKPFTPQQLLTEVARVLGVRAAAGPATT